MRWLLLPTLLVFAAGCDPGVLDGSPAEESPSTSEGVGFPCEVRAMLETYCAGCHTGQTYAPHFYSREDLMGRWTGGLTLAQLAAMAVEQERMPPPTAEVPRPSAAERAILIDWVASGMPLGPCAPLTPPPLR
jgi:hypothetical protein